MKTAKVCFVLLVTIITISFYVSGENYEIGKGNDPADFDAFEEFDSEFEEEDKLEDLEDMYEIDNTAAKEDDFEEFSESQKSPVLGADNISGNEEDDVDIENVDEDDNTDTEEFENVSKTQRENNNSSIPSLSIVNLSSHTEFRYYIEAVLFIGLAAFFLNFFIAKYKNADFATTWVNTNSVVLRENFALVGDDTNLNSDGTNYIKKQSEHLYTVWCSGRTSCEGMLVELKCVKRQDLFSYGLSYLMRDNLDQVHFKISLSKEDMDTYVFCIANKRTAARVSKEMTDLLTFCPERKSGDKFGLPDNFIVMSEINEVRAAFLDHKTLAAFERFADYIDYVHISDRYSGPKPYDESSPTTPTPAPSTSSKPTNSTSASSSSSAAGNIGEKPEHRRMMLVGFSMARGSTLQEIESTVPILTLVLYWLDRIKRLRLSREGKSKAEKNRSRIEEAQLKNTHAARNKAAAARREEKRRIEKEKILEEDDPEKQRKWEEKEMKKQMKRMIPRMKQLKVKSL